MKYYRFEDACGRSWLAVELESGKLLDLTSAWDTARDFEDLLNAARMLRRTPDEAVQALLREESTAPCTFAELEEKGLHLARPLIPKEVWAAGVTYRISREERQKESALPEPYARVYQAERPELFFKATAQRCVGPFEAIGIRGDSTWDVPEPELALVLYRGKIVGYTVGNDVSSRSIEGENPLYLPQAKIYDRCCAIGPCITTPAEIADPQKLEVRCEIVRDGNTIFEGEASTSEMVRSCEELAQFLMGHNRVPDCTVLLTGTGIVPAEEITLLGGDIVRITIEGIGTLENPVVQV
ncbi:MAG: fumarylacetoacetate hydrolase family protein [Acidobacteriota bacterium]